MARRQTTAPSGATAVRVRILCGSAVAIGPGKADLLTAIADTGSISAAARSMRMSYRRAWLLVRTMNTCFTRPLVEAVKGGKTGGGAQLTSTGREVLALYEQTAQDAARRFASYIAPARRGARTRAARRTG